MPKQEKPKRGDIVPLYRQVGWRVCKETAVEEDNQVWIPVLGEPQEKLAEAEILSRLYSIKVKK